MGVTRDAGKAPPEPPRLEGVHEGEVTLGEHVKENGTMVGSVVVCVVGLGFLVVYATAHGRGAAPVAGGALLVVAAAAAVVCGTYAWRRRTAAARTRLYVHGAAVKATVTHVGLDVRRTHGLARYAYVVCWRYMAPDGAAYAGVTPLESMLAAEVGDELWVLVDAQDYQVAQRWDAFRQMGAIQHFDRVQYKTVRPRDPRIMGGITYV